MGLSVFGPFLSLAEVLNLKVCNAGTTDAFSLDATTQIIAGIAVSQVDTLCANDYAIIPGQSFFHWLTSSKVATKNEPDV